MAAMRVRATSPVFVTVTVCGGLVVVSCCMPKVSDWVERASVAGVVPVPESEAVWVPASSVMVKVPVMVPEEVGVKTMETVHPVLGGSVALQVLAVMWKPPVMVGVCRASVVALVLEMVMFWGVVVPLIVVAGKARVSGVRTMGAAGVALPERIAVAWPPRTLA